MILSASGWRKVFAADEESRSPDLRPADRALSLGMADVFASFLADQSPRRPLRVCVGRDARFTGPALADGTIRVLLARGITVDDLGVVAAPEIMAWVQTGGVHDGFVYISASHNPVGHNGVKFGLSDGGVVGGKLSAELIARFRSSVTVENAAHWQELAASAGEAARTVQAKSVQAKQAAAQAYARLGDEILTLSDDAKVQAERKVELAAAVRAKSLGIVGELNGSARGLSIDKTWLEALGVRVLTLNDRPGQFVHRIVPEGASLDLCRRELEKAAAEQPGFALGYVPDCDGDRGNVVWFDAASGSAQILEAQEVFALGVLAELAGLDYYGHTGKVAVVCNDPTSFRVDAVAAAFGASVFRAEVGEANVVALGRALRAEGWTVRIVGEGSNGGNITHPGCVRDPLSTLGGLIKLLCLDSPQKPGPFALWCRRSGQAYRAGFTMADVIATLPRWTTTPASEDRAVLKIQSDHARLKARFEERWPAEWERHLPELTRRFGIVSWTELNYEGTEEKAGVGAAFRSGRQTGGLKLVLKDSGGQSSAMLWMRGSGTEPVFRVMAEVRGHDSDGERRLLEWLTEMVRAADGE